MSKEQAIETVRAQYLAGQVESYNVFWQLERYLSAGQIDALIREWEKEK